MAKQEVPLSDRLSFSVPQAAKVTGISRDTLYGEIRCGRLKSFMAGRRNYRVSRTSLEEWMDERERNASGADPSLVAMR